MAITNLGNVRGPRGFSGMLPLLEVEYTPNLVLAAATETRIGVLTGAISITLAQPTEQESGYSVEWVAQITQGETAQDVVLPVISWSLGIAPTFSANTTTEIRLFYRGDTLEGVWY